MTVTPTFTTYQPNDPWQYRQKRIFNCNHLSDFLPYLNDPHPIVQLTAYKEYLIRAYIIQDINKDKPAGKTYTTPTHLDILMQYYSTHVHNKSKLLGNVTFGDTLMLLHEKILNYFNQYHPSFFSIDKFENYLFNDVLAYKSNLPLAYVISTDQLSAPTQEFFLVKKASYKSMQEFPKHLSRNCDVELHKQCGAIRKIFVARLLGKLKYAVKLEPMEVAKFAPQKELKMLIDYGFKNQDDKLLNQALAIVAMRGFYLDELIYHTNKTVHLACIKSPKFDEINPDVLVDSNICKSFRQDDESLESLIEKYGLLKHQNVITILKNDSLLAKYPLWQNLFDVVTNISYAQQIDDFTNI